MVSRNLQRTVATVLSFLVPVVAIAATEAGYKVKYGGGSVGLKVGTELRLFIEEKQIRLARDKSDVVIIPVSAITEISYGQDVHRRVGTAIGLGTISLGIGALMALSKSKKHFVGITYDDAGKKGGFAFQADKGNYRGVLSGLEGVSGKKAVNSDTLSVKN